MYKKTLILFFLIFLSVPLCGQEDEYLFSGQYTHTPFVDFVSALERDTPFRFFFDYEQVKEIMINTSGQRSDLRKLLGDAFSSAKLKFFIDQYYNVIVYGETWTIIGELPAFQEDKVPEALSVPGENGELTGVEKKYREGKVTAELETLVAGEELKSVPGRNYIIRGRILERETGEPLVGATLYVTETGNGVATDQDGYFRIILKAGSYTARANCLSMKEKAFNLLVYSEGFITLELEKTIINLTEVTVSAKRNDNVEGMQMGFDRVSTQSMKEIPVVMGERDLLKVAQLLPGVQTAGEGSSGLIVRGGNTDQNLFYLNKIPVYNTSHLFGFFSAFSPDVVSDFTLYKSNIPAAYGGRISSVFNIATRAGNKKKFFGQGGISPITGHFELEGPVISDKSSFVVSARSTYSDWLLSRMEDINLKNSNAGFYDVTAGFNLEPDRNNLIKLFGYRSSDQFTLSLTDDYQYTNSGGSLSWKHLFSPSVTGDFSAVWSQYRFLHNDKENLSEAYTHQYLLNHSEFRADMNYLTPGNQKIQFGTSGILYHLDRGDILPFGGESTRIPVILGKEKGYEGAVYLSDEFPVTSSLSLMAGLRYSFFAFLGPADINEYEPGLPKNRDNITGVISVGANRIARFHSGPELRIALNYSTGSNSSVKASYNRIRQYIFMLSNTMAISPDDQWKLSDYHLKPPVSDQLSVGYYHDLPEKGFSGSLEVYRKWISNLVEYKDGVSFISGEKPEMLLLQGQQDAWGVEFMLKKNTGKTTGWLSYAWSGSSVLVDSDIPGNRINNGLRYPSNYDRPHNLSLTTNRRFGRRLSSSLNMVYSTGRPVTYPVAVYYYENQYLLSYSGRNQYRLPDYFRVDFSLNLEGNLLSKKIIHSSWMLNVFNLLGRKNAYSVFFESENGRIRGYKLSVFAQPVITLSWNFKFGNYANE